MEPREDDVFVDCACGFVLVILTDDALVDVAKAIGRHMVTCSGYVERTTGAAGR